MSTALYLVPAPAHDDPPHHLRASASEVDCAPTANQGTLALDWALPSGLPSVPELPEAPAMLWLVPQPDSAQMNDLPNPADWSRRLSQAIVDVFEGRRPATQLVRWTAPDVHARITRIARASATTRGATASTPGRVRSVKIFQPHELSAEVTVVYVSEQRVRAFALRLDVWRGRWRASALEVA